jgi:hypothetical protein
MVLFSLIDDYQGPSLSTSIVCVFLCVCVCVCVCVCRKYSSKKGKIIFPVVICIYETNTLKETKGSNEG